MWEKRNDTRKKKKGTDSQAEQNTHIYQKEKKRKKGITDNILSLEQDMKRTGAEHNENEEARRNMSKSDMLMRRKEKQ